MTNQEIKKLTDYIYSFAWHYGKYWNTGNAEQIMEKIREKIQMPEEFISDMFKTAERHRHQIERLNNMAVTATGDMVHIVKRDKLNTDEGWEG